VYRPAAMEQLRVLGEQIGVDVYLEPENKNPLSIAQNAINQAKATGKKNSDCGYRRSFDLRRCPHA
jgi:signal recognition particle subunit SRP54